jgi:hypothetical protein
MPPEYIDNGFVSNKFDVYSLGAIIMRMMAGAKGYYRYAEVSPAQFVQLVRKIRLFIPRTYTCLFLHII